jgi:HSP20 family protein
VEDFMSYWRRRRRLGNEDDDDDPFGSIFGDFEREFLDIEDTIERMFRNFRALKPSETQLSGPYYYGFSMTVGPDGKPRVREFGNVRPSLKGGLEVGYREPFVDTILDEKGETVKLVAEMPGINKEDIKLEATERNVSIEAERGERKYRTNVPLPYEIEPSSASASFNNGVLEVKLKLKQPEKPKGKKISIM